MHHPNFSLLRVLAPVALATAVWTSSVSAQQYVQLPNGYIATDVTPDGQIVVGNAGAAGGFIWRWKVDPAPTVIPGATVAGTSDDGTVLVGTMKNTVTNKNEAARWTQATGWVLLGGMFGATGCDANLSSGYGISGDGNVIVGLAYGGVSSCTANAFRWTAANGIQSMQLLGNAFNRCTAISRDGSTMGGFAQGQFSKSPAYWDSNLLGQMLDMTYQGEVFGFNNDGSKSVGNSYGAAPFQGAYVRDKQSGTLTNLGTLNAGWKGNAMDISEDGNFICGWDSSGLSGEAWLWTSTDGIKSLQSRLTTAGVQNVPALRAALAMSDDGSVIVGGGSMSPGFIAELPILKNYGAGSPGCAGVPVLTATPAPFVNTPTFHIHSTLAPPSSLGLGLITNVADVNGSDPFAIGVPLHVDLFLSSMVINLDCVSDANGNSTTFAGIPNSPFLAGSTFYAQILWAWPFSTCFIAPYNLSTTQGLAITIQP